MTYDKDSASVSLNNSESITLSVAITTKTNTEADYIYITVDDGTVGNKPAQYDLTLRKDTVELGAGSRKQFILDETDRTARSLRFEAIGRTMEVELTNTSGSAANYDIEVESRVVGGA